MGTVLNGYLKYVYMFYEQGDHAEELIDQENYFYVFTGLIASNKKSVGKILPTIQFSRSIEEFIENLSHTDIPLNSVFADAEGNIYYQHAGRIKVHYDDEGNVISNSGENYKKYANLGLSEIITKSEQYTTDLIPFEHLPFIKNPEKGYIVSANNLVAPENYPYLLPGAFYFDSRARSMEMAIKDMINDGKKITQEMVNEKVLKNVYDPYAIDNIKNTITILQDSYSRSSLKESSIMNNELFKTMLTHDGQNTYNSLPALLYNVL